VVGLDAVALPAPRIAITGTWWRIVRGGDGPFTWTPEPADGRWQTGAVVRGLYLADTEATAWAEWYRHSSELAAPPASRMPRDTWEIAVDVRDVADLTAEGVLAAHGITTLQPSRRQWPKSQAIGEAYFADGARGLLAPSAAHAGGQVLVMFRRGRATPGLRAVPPAHHYTQLPPLPTGLRT
jgi:RES domain-containing protein